MPFQPGQSGNPNGRKKGSLNANTERLRGIVADLLEDNIEQVIKDFEALDAKDRVRAWTLLLEYALPKLQRSETTLSIDSLTDEQVDEMLRRALNIAEQQTDFEDEQAENTI